MDFIIDLIVFLIRALLNQPDRKQATPPRSMPASQAPAPGRQTQAPALAPRTQIAPQRTEDDGERWRLVFTLLGLIVLIVMVAAWILYTRVLLP
jgi:hypothetical protein